MAESWFSLSDADQAEALEVASSRSGRPAHLLEKDVWLVWVLGVMFRAPWGRHLTFKGGTSLSKVFRVIDRFSEDIDLTLDIRCLVPDLLRAGDPIPASASHEKKISHAVRDRLPDWIAENVCSALAAALPATGRAFHLRQTGNNRDTLDLAYPAVRTGTGYASATLKLEFGARSTGEPRQTHSVACDMAPHIADIDFPSAQPHVMAAERTFWEKATAAHVYCLQGRLRGDRYSRHWYDLAALAQSAYFESALASPDIRLQVARHKSRYFAEKTADGDTVDYLAAVSGNLRLIPEGAFLAALQQDYSAMRQDGLLPVSSPDFAQVLSVCRAAQNQVNDRIRLLAKAPGQGVRTDDGA